MKTTLFAFPIIKKTPLTITSFLNTLTQVHKWTGPFRTSDVGLRGLCHGDFVVVFFFYQKCSDN